jgi:polysaccharide pyruvyl transferase WcaK-like protein
MGGYNRSNMFGLRFDYKEFVGSLARRLLSDTGSRLLIVPHVFGKGAENDVHACRALFEILERDFEGRVHLARGEHNQSEIKWIIGKCCFFIGSRMHACIAALSQGIPSVGVAYSKKFLGVFDAVGVGALAVDARQLSMDELIEECMRGLREKDITAASLAETIPRAQQAVRDRFNKDILALPFEK